MLFKFIGSAVKLLGIGRGLPFHRDIRPDIRIVCIELKPFLQTGLRVGYARSMEHAVVDLKHSALSGQNFAA